MEVLAEDAIEELEDWGVEEWLFSSTSSDNIWDGKRNLDEVVAELQPDSIYQAVYGDIKDAMLKARKEKDNRLEIFPAT